MFKIRGRLQMSARNLPAVLPCLRITTQMLPGRVFLDIQIEKLHGRQLGYDKLPR
jgi:hypothetical protein